MKSTSPSPSWLSMAARSPARSMAGTGGDVDRHAHLGGDDPRQARLAKPGWPGEEHVVDRLAPPARRLEDDLEVALQLGLADELGERARPEARLGGDLDLVAQLLGPQQLLAHRCSYRLAAASRWRASRRRPPASPSGGRSAITSRISGSL